MRNEKRPIRYTRHARERMETRGVSEADVEVIVRAGGWRSDGVGSYNEPKWIASGAWAGQRVEVVFVETAEGEIEILRVLTVYV